MADYNIYIHSASSNNGTSDSPTTAWSKDNQGSSSDDNTGAWVNKATQAIGFVQNPDSLIQKGVGAVAKAVPWVAVAYAAVKLGTKAVDTYYNFEVLNTGSYGSQMAWNNVKTALTSALTPFSTTMQYIYSTQQVRIENQKRQLTRELLGDSEINSYSNRGV